MGGVGGVGGYFMGRCPTARCSMPPKSNLHLPLSLSLSPPYSTHPYIVPTISLPFFIYYFFKSLPPSLTLTPLWCIQLKTIRPKHKKIQKCKIQSPPPSSSILLHPPHSMYMYTFEDMPQGLRHHRKGGSHMIRKYAKSL